jgi:YHS domain-containing protein
MNFLARVVRFLFWLLVISWGLRLVRWIVGEILDTPQVPGQPPQGATAGMPESPSARRLVRDPACGMHVDEALSIPLRVGGELHHFCSTACRDAYAGKVAKLAANG